MCVFLVLECVCMCMCVCVCVCARTQVDLVTLRGTSLHNSSATGEAVQPSERTVRLGREIAGLSSDLALSLSSSVCVRVDEDHVSV